MQKILQKNLIKEMGLDKLPEKEQEEIVLKVGKIIFQAVMIRVLEIMSEEDKDEFDNLLGKKKDDEAAVLEFLQAKIPTLDEIVTEEIIKFKKESLNLMKVIG